MASRRWLRGQSDVTVSLSAPRPLTTLGASRSTGPFDEVRRVYGDFATALASRPPASRTAFRSRRLASSVSTQDRARLISIVGRTTTGAHVPPVEQYGGVEAWDVVRARR